MTFGGMVSCGEMKVKEINKLCTCRDWSFCHYTGGWEKHPKRFFRSQSGLARRKKKHKYEVFEKNPGGTIAVPEKRCSHTKTNTGIIT